MSKNDVGHAASDDHDGAPNRARQNVILELGYFIGKLGREKVSAVYVEGVEMPSDIDGVLYIRADDDLDRQLAHEMQEGPARMRARTPP